MKSALLLFCPVVAAWTADFTDAPRFTSVEAFVGEAKSSMLTPGKRVCSFLFSGVSKGVAIPGVTRVDKISEAEVLWRHKEQAMVFVKAEPIYEFGKMKAAVLFLLERESGRWKIADYSRFLPLGESADITFKAMDAGSGDRPLIQVEETHGSGASIKRLDVIYTLEGSKIKRLLQ